jgi:signal transduction histidine kinase
MSAIAAPGRARSVAVSVRAAGRLAAVLYADVAFTIAACVLLFASLLALLAGPVPWLGLSFLLITVYLVRPLARLQRRRIQQLTGREVPEAYQPLPEPLLARVAAVATDPATWRDLAWLAAQSVIGWLSMLNVMLLCAGLAGLFAPVLRALLPAHAQFSVVIPVTSMPRAFLAMPVGMLFLLATWWSRQGTAVGSARLYARLLAPSERETLRARMAHLARTRAQTIDASAAELRRIERDLHDGAQARLVSLAMSLGMAEQEIGSDPQAARQLVAEARSSATTALTELRELVRGMHPPVLSERGLPGAVEALALSSAVPVQAVAELDRRLPAPLESALYFVIAEALANIARHSDAAWAFIRLWQDDGRLRLLVRDDGRGGADPARGSGLRGIQRRLAAFDGSLTLSSPPGGPTELFADLPCPR